jgi:long-chain acyl-CoA synthetase
MEKQVWHAQYDAGVPPSIDYEKLPVPHFLDRAAERWGDHTALVFMNCKLTWSELFDKVQRFAAALDGLGVKPGTSVAIQLPNIPQTVIAYYAALRLGARVVMTNPLYMPREIVHQWKDSGCTVAILADFIWDQKVRALRDELPIEQYVVASIPDFLGFPLNLLAPLKLKKQKPPVWAKVRPEKGLHFMKQLLKDHAPSAPRPEIDWEEVAVLQYTGGTTGPSKGAMLTHANLSVNVQQTNGWFTGVELGGEVILTALPLFHVFGMTVCMNWAVYSGAAMILMPNPRDIPMLIKCVSKHKITCFPAVPALFNALNNYPGIENIDVSSIRRCFSGSAPIPNDVLRRFERLTGSVIVEGFGMSETSPVTHVNPLEGQRKLGSVGIPVSDTEARIVDSEDGVHDMPIGEEGELIIRGPQVMKGYWNRPEETAAALRAGWMHTGDLAAMDEDGYFRIVGRKKDMINCGGFKVFPDEVDAVLMAHDKILEAATIGVPDEKRGETVKSFVVLQPDQRMSVEDVEAYCREHLAAYKVPRQVEFLDELPKSTVMKVLRRELRERG